MSQQLQTHTTDTLLFISRTTNVLLFKFRCDIFIGVRIIKEMPGSVASGTHCTNTFSNITLQVHYVVYLLFNDALLTTAKPLHLFVSVNPTHYGPAGSKANAFHLSQVLACILIFVAELNYLVFSKTELLFAHF